MSATFAIYIAKFAIFNIILICYNKVNEGCADEAKKQKEMLVWQRITKAVLPLKTE